MSVNLVRFYGRKHIVRTGVIGLIVCFSAIRVLANVTRRSGKQVEEMLLAKWGDKPTTIALHEVMDTRELVTHCEK